MHCVEKKSIIVHFGATATDPQKNLQLNLWVLSKSDYFPRLKVHFQTSYRLMCLPLCYVNSDSIGVDVIAKLDPEILTDAC